MHTILAQAQAAGISPYFSLIKILAVIVLYVGWLFASQWTDRDADRCKTSREWWNLLVMGGGYGGLAVLLLFPWSGSAFFLGLAFWVTLAAGTLIAYVVHRNGRMVPAARVLTKDHFKRTMASLKGEGKAKVDKGIRVKLVDFDGKSVEKPSEVGLLEQFDVTQDFLFDMLWKRATDVDVLIQPENPRVVYKIDGVVAEQEGRLTVDDAEKLIGYLKLLAGLNAEERRRPQTGTVKVALLGGGEKPVPLEVTTSGSTAGERLRLRLCRAADLLRVDSLGLADDTLAVFKKLVELDTGLVIFAGPKESGITTAQYATLRAHDSYMQNIYTLEHEKMLKLDNITQQIFDKQKAEVTYARQFQTILRREPDVVMLDSCEDRETAQLACAAAKEKKVYVTIRAASAFDALARFQALVEDPKAVASVLCGVLGLRLLRVLCEACREAYKPDEQLLHKANLPVDEIEHFYRPPSSPIVDKKGREIICQSCQNSHYVGRTGTFELLVATKAIRTLIAAGEPIKKIKGQARAEKMRYLQEDGLLKVIAGTTSMAEVMRGLRADAK